jgi:hypothetical protein
MGKVFGNFGGVSPFIESDERHLYFTGNPNKNQ